MKTKWSWIRWAARLPGWNTVTARMAFWERQVNRACWRNERKCKRDIERRAARTGTRQRSLAAARLGKGWCSSSFPLSDGAALRLTIARYYTPVGRNIQKPYDKGLENYEDELMNRFSDGEVLWWGYVGLKKAQPLNARQPYCLWRRRHYPDILFLTILPRSRRGS